jgi:hypothetical protein
MQELTAICSRNKRTRLALRHPVICFPMLSRFMSCPSVNLYSRLKFCVSWNSHRVSAYTSLNTGRS